MKRRGINKPICLQRTNCQRQREIKGRRKEGSFHGTVEDSQLRSFPPTDDLIAEANLHRTIGLESQMTVFKPSTDCSLWKRDQQTERRTVEGDRAFGGEERGGREGRRQLLTGALSEPAGTILQWVSNETLLRLFLQTGQSKNDLFGESV